VAVVFQTGLKSPKEASSGELQDTGNQHLDKHNGHWSQIPKMTLKNERKTKRTP
jgi:hypothetical protein